MVVGSSLYCISCLRSTVYSTVHFLLTQDLKWTVAESVPVSDTATSLYIQSLMTGNSRIQHHTQVVTRDFHVTNASLPVANGSVPAIAVWVAPFAALATGVDTPEMQKKHQHVYRVDLSELGTVYTLECSKGEQIDLENYDFTSTSLQPWAFAVSNSHRNVVSAGSSIPANLF